MVGKKHDLKFRDTNSHMNSAFLPAGWILCVASPREKPCSIKKLYSIQKAANVLKFGFPPNYLSRVTLPQPKARKESNICKCLFWKWILLPARIAAHCIWHRFGGGEISKLVSFLQQSAVEVGLCRVFSIQHLTESQYFFFFFYIQTNGDRWRSYRERAGAVDLSGDRSSLAWMLLNASKFAFLWRCVCLPLLALPLLWAGAPGREAETWR